MVCQFRGAAEVRIPAGPMGVNKLRSQTLEQSFRFQRASQREDAREICLFTNPIRAGKTLTSFRSLIVQAYSPVIIMSVKHLTVLKTFFFSRVLPAFCIGGAHTQRAERCVDQFIRRGRLTSLAAGSLETSLAPKSSVVMIFSPQPAEPAATAPAIGLFHQL